jgi:hypothetical protein
MSVAPAALRSIADCFPIPDVAPVTKTVFPENEYISGILSMV